MQTTHMAKRHLAQPVQTASFAFGPLAGLSIRPWLGKSFPGRGGDRAKPSSGACCRGSHAAAWVSSPRFSCLLPEVETPRWGWEGLAAWAELAHPSPAEEARRFPLPWSGWVHPFLLPAPLLSAPPRRLSALLLFPHQHAGFPVPRGVSRRDLREYRRLCPAAAFLFAPLSPVRASLPLPASCS